MKRIDIPYDELSLEVFRTWETQWLLLCAGEYPDNFNIMTVAWGAFGVLWARPVAMIVVRPERHTYGFLETHDSFTLCAFPEEHKDKLSFCGKKSGRSVDKVKECGFTPIASRKTKAPGFAEAELIVECGKIYFSDLVPGNFLAEFIAPNYPTKNYHRIYIGEVLAVSGSPKYGKQR
jgi:flavin reductase (DIM6/NTAB) family NADH-FMN oxidoreductase RutF